MSSETRTRTFPVGAEVMPQGVSFRVWAPLRQSVSVVLDSPVSDPICLSSENNGYFSVTTSAAGHGMLYRFRLDDDPKLYPDPASRFQPQGPHGPSQVVDPDRFQWGDVAWTGLVARELVVYELHVGTFTAAGTWPAATDRLAELADVGITAVEVLPVADFPGQFGWGYDGVNLFAPTRLYGTPEDFRRFVDAAHALGIGVILDVVYNHLGPDGNYLPAFSPDVFTDRYENEWGDAINFDGDHSGPVREFMCANAAYWIREFHLDGLRLDATQSIHDASERHILADLTEAARTAARSRTIYIVAENEPQRIDHVRSVTAGGYGMDALWNDDFHHSAVVALGGRSEAYYTDYRGSPQEFISAAKRGYLYQGQWYAWQKKRRGTPALDVSPHRFVAFIENHDQIANTGRGQRLHQVSHPSGYRAMTALLLLGPWTPMLFQGQEFASTRPFLYFADHVPELSRKVHQGRRDFVRQFPSLATPAMQALVLDPADPATFDDCKLDWSERDQHGTSVALHRDLLALRRSDPVLTQDPPRVDGAVLGAQAFVLRFFGDDGADRLLLINLGPDHCLLPAPEPLLAEPRGHDWQCSWSSEAPRYGGHGVPDINWNGNLLLPGHCALFVTSSLRSD